jgi:hypothetical protein
MPAIPEPSTRIDSDWQEFLKSTESRGMSYRARAVVVVLLVGAVFAGGFLLFDRVWTLSVQNSGTVPCTVIVTLDSADGERLEFPDVPAAKGYEQVELIRRRKSAIIHSVRLIRGDGRDKVVRLDQPISPGSELRVDFDARFEIRTDLDEDRHM